MLFGLLWYYFGIARSLPCQYYDEFWWVGDSFFFDLVLHDKDNPVWQSVYAYDQPKLTHYFFGMILYPLYIAEKKNDTSLTYLQFLSNRRLLCRECIGASYLPKNITVTSRKEFENNTISSGFAQARSLVTQVRYGNAIVAGVTIIAVYVLGLAFWRPWWAMAFTVLYGLNNLMIRSVLVAHAEALLLMFWSIAITFLYWFIRKRSMKALLLFSVAAGLCASVKLSGFALIPLFVIIELLHVCAARKRSDVLFVFIRDIAVVYIVSFGLFYILNPQIHYPSLILGFKKMIAHRVAQQSVFPIWYPEAALPNTGKKLWSLADGFFGVQQAPFSALYPFAAVIGWHHLAYSTMFIVGLFAIFKNAYVQNRLLESVLYIPILLCVAIGATFTWLTVAWDRYYALLILPILVVEFEGLRFMAISIWNVRRRLSLFRF